MNVHALPRHFSLADFQPEQEEQPMAQEQSPSYTPEALPTLEGLEKIASEIFTMARDARTSGQMIVHSLRMRRANIDRESDTIARDYMAEIDRLQRDFEVRLEQNRNEAAEVDGMIARYTNEPAQQPEPQQILPPQRPAKLLGFFGRG
ncbi:MAG: hypothetical protein M3O03_12200 [Pseudomonadota bacterium]|nr:hypothetical protein [Pseudomonadota bacterium]